MVIEDRSFKGIQDFSISEVAPFNRCNFGITMATEKFSAIFEKYPQRRFLDVHEFIGYIQASNYGTFISDNNAIMAL